VSAATIPFAYWLAFCGFVVTALALDLGLFHRQEQETSFRAAMLWTAVWVAAALGFAFGAAPRLVPGWTSEYSATFVTGYVVELSLSMDNVFVIALIFNYFKVPREWQHRVLFWGILGALVLRGVMIWAGSELVTHFHWTLYVMGAFLLFTGGRILFSTNEEEETPDLSRNLVVRLANRFLPVAATFEGQRFVTRQNGRRVLTPLAVVLLVVETTDVVFAVDSIPAIFGITSTPFLIFTSNVFAILGLRSLYLVLASAMGYFRHLKAGLALVLVMIGAKMLGEHFLKRWLGDDLTHLSLVAVIGIIGISVASSLLMAWRERRSQPPEGQ
jgi:tellurite resistance protein TerC